MDMLLAAISALVGVAIGGTIAWVLCANRTQQTILELTERTAQAEAHLEAERSANAEKRAALQEAEQRMQEVFASLGSKVLKENTSYFLSLVQKQLEQQQHTAKSDLTLHKQELDALLEPLKTMLEQQRQNIGILEQARQQSYGKIDEQLKRMSEDQQRLQAETANLVKALRQPHVRGRWGEMQLQRVVELAGMHEYCDFFQQQSSVSSDGKQQRPDMQVRLPNNRHIIIDAKVPLTAYLEALEATDDGVRSERLHAHARHIRSHIDDMKKRGYHQHIDGSHDFTVLFIPGEVFYSAALQHDHALLDYAFQNHIILANPTTLIALLKAVALGWQETRLAENAQQIKTIGEELYKRLGVVAGHMIDLGKSLDKSVDAYNKAVGSIERNLLTSARRMHDLQIGSDAPGELEPIEKTSRSFSKEDLT
jgi:DNA recombination protein RmuC